jgi:hypothetical protein
MTIEGTVRKTDLCLRMPLSPITSGCKNSVFLALRFSPHWRAYPHRYAFLRQKDGVRALARVSRAGVCVIPEEILRRSGRVFVSVVGCRRGGKEESARVVTEVTSFTVAPGIYAEEEEEAESDEQ